MYKCSLYNCWNTYSSNSSCLSIVVENMYISSRYTHTSTPMRSRNTNIISLCQDDGPLQSPCWSTLLTYVPNRDAKSVFETSSGTMRNCSYASEMSVTRLVSAPPTGAN